MSEIGTKDSSAGTGIFMLCLLGVGGGGLWAGTGNFCIALGAVCLVFFLGLAIVEPLDGIEKAIRESKKLIIP